MFVGGAGEDADGCAREIGERSSVERFFDKDTPTVIECGGQELESDRGVTIGGEGGIAYQHIHFTALHGGETRGGAQRAIFDFADIIEQCGGNRAAEFRVNALITAVRFERAKAGGLTADATDERAAIQNGLETPAHFGPDRSRRRCGGSTGRGGWLRRGGGLCDLGWGSRWLRHRGRLRRAGGRCNSRRSDGGAGTGTDSKCNKCNCNQYEKRIALHFSSSQGTCRGVTHAALQLGIKQY